MVGGAAGAGLSGSGSTETSILAAISGETRGPTVRTFENLFVNNSSVSLVEGRFIYASIQEMYVSGFILVFTEITYYLVSNSVVNNLSSNTLTEKRVSG